MFKTKLEVDKHVDNCLKKINNETERNLKSFSFAKLYFSIGDYEHARRYVSSYLNVKPKSAEGYHLLGKCLEKMNKKDAALEAYKNSLELDSKQNNLVIKVCELLSSDDVDMDPSGAKYFCELAQSFDPSNTAVYRLREKLITKQSDDPLEISRLLVKELESRPSDVNLRVRLIKHFLQYNMINEAYKHASAIEEKNSSIFNNKISWYETFSEVLVKFQRDVSLRSQITWEFWFLSVSVLDKLVTLSLDEHIENPKTSSEYIAAVFNFDQILTTASQCVNTCPDRQLVSFFLNHYYGQLHFHLATLAHKQAKSDLLTFKEVTNITIPLIFIAYHSSPPDIQSLWFIHTSQLNKRHIQQWYKEASYRCSQMGHLLLASAEHCKSSLVEKAAHYTTGMWREQFFKKVFVKRDHHLNIKTSHFVSNPQQIDPIFKLPDPEDVYKYDEVAQLMYPDSLHYYIWIALNNKLPNLEVKTFDGLQYSVKNFNNCAAESLSLLDIQTFLYCATLCVKSNADEKRTSYYYSRDKPNLLPAAITDSLGSIKQSNFFKVAYKMYKNETEASMTETRLLLIKGIETIRCVGNHGLDVELLVKLAEIFEERSQKLTKQSEIEYNTARADLYWSHALRLLEKIKNNKLVSYSNSGFFEYKSNEVSLSNVSKYIEKGKLFTGYQLIKKKEYEKALHILEQLKDPYASFYQSQIYKNMADQTTNDSKENVTSEMRSQHIILLSRSRDCLYLTLDRLRDPSIDRSHPLNSQLGTEIEKVERLLSRIDPDCINRNECDGMSDENQSSDNSVGEQYISTYSFINGQSFTPKHENHNHSTPLRFNIPRQEAKPSPERLDAQIRQIAASRDAAFSMFTDQNKLIVESHRNMLEEFKNFKGAFNSLTTVIEELNVFRLGLEKIESIEKSVTEIKNSFDLSNLLDTIQEMRKEINELKREQNKTNQLSDEDLHFLDPDYTVDYNINSNIGYNPGVPSMYTNFHPGRIQNPNPLNAYPGLYHPSIYPGFYGPLSIPPQQGTISFPTDQNPGTSSLAGYPQPILSHVSLASTLSNPSLGVGLLTGQSLPQVISPSPRTLIGDVTHTQSSSTSVTTTGLISTSKAPPVNVVITSSDPLPTNVIPISQPILSVTIPPQHLKGNIPKTQPHNYQIPLPSSNISQLTTTPSVLSKPPPSIKTQSILSNVAPPVFSAIPQNKESTKYHSSGSQGDRKSEQIQNSEKNLSLNKSNISSNSIEEHDPCPDFKPIIPLPDEVPVSTGEEGEIELFCEHAKLFRHVNTNGVKEWKERGVGILKILHNPKTRKVRILMRRDQVHKICANHFVTTEMSLTPMAKNDKAFIWVAHDFADEVVVIETFCVKFKTTEQANSFHKSFIDAKLLSESVVEEDKKDYTPCSSVITQSYIPKQSDSQGSLGGFVFTSTPTFKLKEPITSAKIPDVQDMPNSPFSNFSFGKTANLFKTPVSSSEAAVFSPLVIAQETSTTQNDEEGGSNAEDFVPTAEFKPVVALPDLVEVKTGEEDMFVLFENRCKLFRFDPVTKEWKERGVGNIKVLKGEDVRLVMRRDQVHKVCCNHTVLKNMKFSLKGGVGKTVLWTAQDFSEGVLKTETFTARFKTEEQGSEFLQILQSAQTSLNEQNKIVGNKLHKTETRPRTTSFGDKFKPAKGSWECKNCYIINDGKANFCVACETPKSGSTPKKTEESGPAFSFGNFTNTAENSNLSSGLVFGQKPIASSWGSAFKSTEGSWECKTCYVRNGNEKDQCVSCTALKPGISNEGAIQTIDIKSSGINLEQEVAKTSSVVGFGDTFKPTTGSWECKVCLVRNNPDVSYCVSCENPKDDNIPKKDMNKGINLDTSGLKFNFGMQFVTKVPSSSEINTNLSNQLFNSTKIESNTKSSSNRVSQETKFVFGSPQKHEFEFKPKSPKKSISGQGDEESDENYTDEEGDNIYFKPVIPLPDKVDVKTGEEDENVLYCHRAKLFRFVNSEWKERGLGDIKILKRKDTGKLRVVMRREQVFKLCLNHNLTSNMEYIKKDDRSWLFHAADYSEGELVHEQYCLRFKSAEVAEEFINAVKHALENSISNQQVTNAKCDENSDDIEIVSETKVTAEEEKEALALGLPPKFFSYRQRPDCSCDQCKKDDLYLKNLLSSDIRKFEHSSPENIGSGAVSSNIKQGTSVLPITGSSSVVENHKKESGDATTNATTLSTPTFSFTAKQQSLKDVLVKPSRLITDDSKNVSNENSAKNDKPFSFSTAFSSNANIFSQPVTTSIFSNNTGGLFTNPTGIFNSPTNYFGNVFGNSNSNAKTSVTPIFGNSTKVNDLNTSNTNIISSNSSIFGASNLSELSQSRSSSVFGNTLNNSFLSTNSSTTKSLGPTESITTDTPISKTNSSNVSFTFSEPKIIENSAKTISFGDVSQNANYSETKTTNLKEDDEIILKCNTDISFASLAAQVKPDAKPSFTTTGDNSFSFLGAGAPVFESSGKSFKKKTAVAAVSHNESDDETADDNAEEEYDPHYEPIIPLPEAITVSTGEEDETILFNERAKLFRYDDDTKEWKERGVGQLKILNHPEQNTFRLLLRREQVHKVVLNQLIIPNLQLQPMMSSDKAWMWAGYNYTDDGNELEKLAVRFKNSEIAIQFQRFFNDCVVKITNIQNSRSLPSNEQNTGLEDISSDEQNTLDDPNNEDYEDEEEEEDDRSIMFMKRCTFSEQMPNGSWNTVIEGDGELQVYYDPELYASRISFNDDTGNVLSNTLIGINTAMNIEGNECTWRGVEWADGHTRWRSLKATFSNREDADEFHANYLESVNYAHQIEVVDEIPTEADTETEE